MGIQKDKYEVFLQRLRQTLLIAILFFSVTMPFRHFFGLTGLTEVRPAAAFPPAFGILFGVWGALGCAIGNLCADLLSGYGMKVCWYGFAAQFLYGYLPWLLWHGTKKKAEVRIDSVRRVLRYIAVVTLDALYIALALGLILQLLGLGKLISEATMILFSNNLVFSLILGIPILILNGLFKKQERGKVLTLNVRFVLIFLVLCVLSAVVVGVVTYEELCRYVPDAVTLWNRIYLRVSFDFFLLWGLAVCFLRQLEKNITVPVEKLTGIARSYMSNGIKAAAVWEDLREQCGRLCRVHGEPGELAAAFQKMMKDMEHYVDAVTAVTAEKERIRSELTVAARMQADMLPDSALELKDRKEFSLCTRMAPAKEVGGDFYDFFLLDENRLALIMADVSGKGVPAALFMVVARTLLRSFTASEQSLAEAVTKVNNSLCANNKNGMFVTAWIGIVTLSTGELLYVNAGHNAPLLAKKNGAYVYLTERTGFVLAGMEDISYRQAKLILEPGDALFLYTDGVTEAHDAHKNLYGDDRLILQLNRKPEDEPGKTIDKVWRDLLVFQGRAEQFDDITMLSIRFLGGNQETAYQTLTGAADQNRMEEIQDFVKKVLMEGKFPQKLYGKMFVAVDEVFSNICRCSGAAKVTVVCRADEKEARLWFEDDGRPYNPLDEKDPDVTAALEERKEGGLGIYLVKKQMDEVKYAYQDGKNCFMVRRKV